MREIDDKLSYVLLEANELYPSEELQRCREILGIEDFPEALKEAKRLIEDIAAEPYHLGIAPDVYREKIVGIVKQYAPRAIGFALAGMPTPELREGVKRESIVLETLIAFSRQYFKVNENRLIQEVAHQGGISLRKLSQDTEFISNMVREVVDNPIGAHIDKAHTNAVLGDYPEQPQEVDLTAGQASVDPLHEDAHLVDRAMYHGMVNVLNEMSEEELLSRPELMSAFSGADIDPKDFKRWIRTRPKIRNFWINALNTFIFFHQFSWFKFNLSFTGSPVLKPVWIAFLKHHYERLSGNEESTKTFGELLASFWEACPQELSSLIDEAFRNEKAKKGPSDRSPKPVKKVEKADKPKKKRKPRRNTRITPVEQEAGIVDKVEDVVALPKPEVVGGEESLSKRFALGQYGVELTNVPEEAAFLLINSGRGANYQRIPLVKGQSVYRFRSPKYKSGKFYEVKIGYARADEKLVPENSLVVKFQHPVSEVVPPATEKDLETFEVPAEFEPGVLSGNSETESSHEEGGVVQPAEELVPENTEPIAYLNNLKLLSRRYNLDDFQLSNNRGFVWDQCIGRPSMSLSGENEGVSFEISKVPMIGMVGVTLECEHFSVDVIFSKTKASVVSPKIMVRHTDKNFTDKNIEDFAHGWLYDFSFQYSDGLRETLDQKVEEDKKREEEVFVRQKAKYLNSEKGKDVLRKKQEVLRSGGILRVLRTDDSGGYVKELLPSSEIHPEDEIILMGATLSVGRENFPSLYEALESPYFCHCIYQRIRATVKQAHGLNGEARTPFEDKYKDAVFSILSAFEIDEEDIALDESDFWFQVEDLLTKGNTHIIESFIDLLKDQGLPAGFQHPFTLDRETIEKFKS